MILDLESKKNYLKKQHEEDDEELVDTNEISLELLYDYAKFIDRNSTDFMLVGNEKFNLTSNNRNQVVMELEGGEYSFDVDNTPMYRFKFSDYALGQLCGKLDIPSRYIKKCLENDYDILAIDNLNWWLLRSNKTLRFRTCLDRVRGVLSDKYTLLDSHEILEVLKEVFDENEYVVKGYYLSEERLHVRLVTREPLIEDLYLGVIVDSSDVGRSALRCRVFLYKQICTNGLMIATNNAVLYEQKHIGVSKETFREELKESLVRLPIFKKYVLDSVNGAKKWGMKTLLSETMGVHEDYVEELHKFLKNKFKLSNKGVESVIEYQHNNYSYDAWGLINAVTEYAQECTLERRIELEELAGAFLDEVGGKRNG